MKRAWLVVTALVLASAAAAAQTDINAVVKLVEARYHARHHGVPLLWIAKPFMIGSGAGGIKMALFENLRVPSSDLISLQKSVRQALGPEWSPFVEARSNQTGEWSAIYVRPRGHKLHMIIVDADRDDCTVMQLHVSGTPRDEWIRQPVKKARNNKAAEQRAAIGVAGANSGAGVNTTAK